MLAEFQVQARLKDGIGDLIRVLNILAVADAQLEGVDAKFSEDQLQVVVRFRSEADRAALCQARLGRLAMLEDLGDLAAGAHGGACA